MPSPVSSAPYLSHGRRLADVLAALQVLGSYTFSSCKQSTWAEKLGMPLSAEAWAVVFEEHPEFFRVNGEWVTLRWRHGYDRIFAHEHRRELSSDEISVLTEEQRANLTRRSLTSEEIGVLMKTAIELHTREIAHSQERRWLTPLLFALLGTIVGVVLQAALK